MTTATPVSAGPDELRWAPPWLMFAVIALTFIGAFAAVVTLPHNSYVRFQQLARTLQFRTQWAFERIELDPTPIDVALIGNSRLEAGVRGSELQAALSRAEGRPVHVANLALPQEGRNLHYVMVKRLLERRPEVKLIVLSAVEQMPRDGHPAFRDLADASDVLSAPILINRSYANDIAVLPFRQLSLFVQSRFPELFGRRTTLSPQAYAAEVSDGTKTFRLPDGRVIDRDSLADPYALAQAARKRVATTVPPVLGADYADYEFPVERRYTRAIADMARAHGVSIIFLDLPIYLNRKPLGQLNFYQAIGPVLRPPSFEDDYRLYSDDSHLNRNGSARLTRWLGGEIATLAREGKIYSLAPSGKPMQ